MSTTPRHRRMLAAAITAALLLAACHGAKDIALPEPSAPAEPVATQPREMTVTNFTATVEGVSVNGQLRIATDSVMWLTISKIVELGRAMATPDSVWVTAPLLDKRFVGDYGDLSRRAKRQVTFRTLQDIATDENAEELIESLAQSMGYNARVRFISRRKVERLSFPFAKP